MMLKCKSCLTFIPFQTVESCQELNYMMSLPDNNDNLIAPILKRELQQNLITVRTM